MYKKIFGVMLLCFVLTACDKIFPPKPFTTETPTTKTPPIKGAVLARVNYWAIGTEDFQERLKIFGKLYPKVDISDPAVKKRLLKEIIDTEILIQEAVNRGWDKTRDVQEAMEASKRDALIKRWSAELAREIVVSNAEVESFYKTYSVHFKEPEERRIKEIVLSTEREARDIVGRLGQGENFADLAKTYSIAASRDKGGDLEYISNTSKAKFPKFLEIAFALDRGETSNYFKGPDGAYYIIKVEDIKGGSVTPLSEAKDGIEDILKAEKVAQKIADVVDKFKQKNKVEANASLLD